MFQDKITFDKLPEMVEIILKQVKKISSIIEQERQPIKSRVPISIEEACLIIKKAKPTVYKLARSGSIPSYKNGKKLYFYEEELIGWVDSGKRKTTAEIKAEIEAAMQSSKFKRPTKR